MTRPAHGSPAVRQPAGPFFGIGAGAKYLGTSRWTLARLIDRGEIPVHYVNDQRKVAQPDLDRYVKARARRRAQAS